MGSDEGARSLRPLHRNRMVPGCVIRAHQGTMHEINLAWRYRLPNPPPLLVGRKEAVKSFAASIARGPLAVISGDAGVGKTAVALQALFPHVDAAHPTVIYLPLLNHVGSPSRHIARNVADALQVKDIAWHEVGERSQALIALAVDLADASGVWVFLDSMDVVSADETDDILLHLRTYSRRARWIVATRRTTWNWQEALHCIHLQPMASANMSQLAQLWAPARSVEERVLLVEAAKGQLLIDKVRMRLHYREIITMTAPDRDQERPQASTKPNCGLDEKSQKVWLEDGTSVSLKRKPLLWRLLWSLYQHGGEATKEQLVENLWSVHYHPLQHDNRLRVTVHKARRVLCPTPGSPPLLETTEHGYRLGTPFRVAHRNS